MNEYLYVMDYSDSTISRIDVTNIKIDDVEEFLYQYGFKTSQCSYMFSDKLIETVTKIVDER